MAVKEINISGVNFKVGETYQNRQGYYQVLKINSDKLKILQGENVKEIDLLIAARMIQNMTIEEVKKSSGIKERNKQEDYYFTLGILAARGMFSAEVGYHYWNTFAKKYFIITGQFENIPFAYRMDINTNKPGSELRIEISKDIIFHERFCLPEDVKPVTDKNGKTTINKNSFWWDLVEKFGFRTGSIQNVETILKNVPEKFKEHFKAGYEQFKK